MQSVSHEDVERIRKGIERAHVLAAERFRAEFARRTLGAEEAGRTHLELQAAALMECAVHVRLRAASGLSGPSPSPPVRYQIDDSIATPYVTPGEPLFPYFAAPQTAAAVFEYWMLISELLASAAWRVTKVLASPAAYDVALGLMRQPQIVRAIPPPFLPSAELRDDGTALLEVTLYTRAGEERVERRMLILDEDNEFAFHTRVLIAEGSGGVEV